MNPHTWGKGDTRRIATRDVPEAVKALVDKRQNGRYCIACSGIAPRAMPAGRSELNPLELDHLQPHSKGGDNHHLNLRWLCRSHNRGRSNRKTTPVISKEQRRAARESQ